MRERNPPRKLGTPPTGPQQRHSFASNLLAAGVHVVTVWKALGHANVHFTLVTYAHAIPKQRHGAGDAAA